MRKIALIILVALSLLSIVESKAQSRRDMIDSLSTIDPDIRKYFPRWRICETDLQIQIYQAFKLIGFNEKMLDRSKIEILAAPHPDPYVSFDILLITCGRSVLNSAEINVNFGKNLYDILSGEAYFARRNNPPNSEIRTRDYCFIEIPPEVPVSATEADAIINFLRPSNVTHAFSLSLFEQSLKIGKTGFWLSSTIGNDDVGLPFWTAGQSRITLQRPLYANNDPKTSNRIPYLINAFMGGSYRLTSGINPNGTVLSWIPARHLNSGPGGKLVAGLDFNMPFHPQFGVHFNMEIPMNETRREAIEESKYAYVPMREEVGFNTDDYRYGNKDFTFKNVTTLLRGTGQFSLFYCLWLGENKGDFENFFRFDLGMSYMEAKEYGVYRDDKNYVSYIEPFGIDGLKTYKPNEFGDWVYAKAEYRNQAIWPFGLSVQYSNQTMLGRVYVPLVNWLYIEAKVATLLRGARPYENKTFFMLSPVLRLTI